MKKSNRVRYLVRMYSLVTDDIITKVIDAESIQEVNKICDKYVHEHPYYETGYDIYLDTSYFRDEDIDEFVQSKYALWEV